MRAYGTRLNKDQGANKDIRVSHILLELCVVGLISQFLEDVTHTLDANIRLQSTHAQTKSDATLPPASRIDVNKIVQAG